MHEGIRYQCNECEKNYICSSSLTKHKRVKHNQTPVCIPCNREDEIDAFNNDSIDKNEFDEVIQLLLEYTEEEEEEEEEEEDNR